MTLWVLLAFRPEAADTADSGPATDTPAAVSHDQQIQPLWEASCTGGLCHGVDGDAPLRLTAEEAWEQLVDRPSMEAPLLDLVEPGRPDQSYLVHKLKGTQIEAGGRGLALPFEVELLTEEEWGRVEAWVLGGAER